MKYYALFFCLSFLNCWHWLSAQDKTPAQLTTNLAARYIDSVSNQATIFYGKIQEPYWLEVSNHPYFKDSKYVRGKLRYGGINYSDIPLRWDLCRDELIVLSPDNYNLVLVPGKTEDAELHGYHISYLKQDTLKNSLPTGYYLLLHVGQCTIFGKHTAILQQKTYQQRIEHHYSITTKYYIKKDETYFPIKNKSSLLNALGNYQKELEQFIRVNKFRFKRDAEKMIIAVVKEYEKLYNP